jgi:O-antigen ligase
MALAAFLTTRHTRGFTLLPLLVGLGAGAIGLTFTRGAWIGLLMGLIVIVWRASRARMLNTAKLAAIGVGVLVLGLALLPKMSERLASDYGEDAGSSSADERLGLIRIAINVIIGNPIFGVGPGAYDNEFKAYVPPGLSQWIYTVHNEFLLRTAETGLLGGFAFIWFMYSGFRVASRLYRSPDLNTKVLGIGWAAGLASLIVQMNLVPWRGFSYNAMLWMFMGLMDAFDRLNEQRLPAKDEFTLGAADRRAQFGGTNSGL